MLNKKDEETQNRIEKIAHYYANPLDQRTIKEFVAEEQLSETTFWRYKKEFRDEIFNRAEALRKMYHSEIRSYGYKALLGRAKKSDNAAKLLFQLLGDLVERTENITKFETPEEKRTKLANLLKNAGLTVSLEASNNPENINTKLKEG